MKSIKQVRCEARHLYRLCLVNGSLDEGRVRRVVRHILDSKRRGYLALINQFERFVKIERSRHLAEVESAAPLAPGLEASVRESLTRLYGPGMEISFALNPSLIGGMRVRVGSDVYDGSVRAGLAALERRFGLDGANTNGSDARPPT
ncbi:MAG TPA: F0F1 ATP synthase subunit delta [Pyrinomonadaceae bacterium]|nr:F0F1 ATP synthase subunit delta [Pyrinomonadaceae bacterium]